MKDKALILAGKFNPIHDGHVAIIQRMLRDCIKNNMAPVICVIGTDKTTPDKPFGVTERAHMIKEMFPNVNVQSFTNAFQAFEELDATYEITGVVCGSDRLGEYEGVYTRATKKIPKWPASVVIERNSDNHVSSSLIRDLVKQGEIDKAGKYLNTVKESIRQKILTEI